MTSRQQDGDKTGRASYQRCCSEQRLTSNDVISIALLYIICVFSVSKLTAYSSSAPTLEWARACRHRLEQHRPRCWELICAKTLGMIDSLRPVTSYSVYVDRWQQDTRVKTCRFDKSSFLLWYSATCDGCSPLYTTTLCQLVSVNGSKMASIYRNIDSFCLQTFNSQIVT